MTPPNDYQAEVWIIGAILKNPNCMDDIDFLKTNDFYDETLGNIYAAMLEVQRRNEYINKISVYAQLREWKKDRDLKVGPEDDPASNYDVFDWIIKNVPTDAGIKTDARLVKNAAQRRQAITVAYQIINEAEKGCDDLDDWIGNNVASLEDITRIHDNEPEGTCSRMSRFLHNYDDITQKTAGPKTGFPDLDKLLPRGLQGGRMILLAGRPKMGKSLIATNIASNLSKRGLSSLRFTMEMRKEEETARELSAATGVEAQLVADPKHKDAIIDAARSMASGKLGEVYVDDTRNTFTSISACSRRMWRRHNIALIIIDHIGLMQHWDKKATTERQVSEHAIGLKRLAMQLNVPFLVLAQLNRQCDHREDKRPMMADVRSSGETEQSADVIAMLYREAVYEEDFPSTLSELNIVKNRSGHEGRVYLWFDGPGSKFNSVDRASLDKAFDQINKWRESSNKNGVKMNRKTSNGNN
jgi:replicative DNA helicase